MAKIKKKGTSGAAKNYITRSAAVRKLQISLPDFRRLCIYKGIYPREPRNKKKAAKSSTPSTTFYYTKDIQYLLHEPLLARLRDRYALLRKIQRALGRGQVNDASRLERTQMPRLRLDHIVKERYPTFVDALRDLDDCLSMLFLFANLPSSKHVPTKTIALCQRLCLEFEHYLIVSHTLRKSFLSIKGIYYGAEVQGQDILWLVPYKFVQQVTGDVDFRIMATFVEFYACLLSFVNYRLYTQVGLVYPPKFNKASDEEGGELGAFSLEGRAIDSGPQTQAIVDGPTTSASTDVATMATIDSEVTAKAQALADSLALTASTIDPSDPSATADADAIEQTNQIDTFEPTSTSADTSILPQPSSTSSETAATLFADFTFFLSRETPRAPLEFLLKAFGCKRVAWDTVLGDGAWINDERDARITHQVVDRPPFAPDPTVAAGDDPNGDTAMSEDLTRVPAGARVPGRTYVQPQWVWDCVNAGRLLRPDQYAPGATLPPHLSPWVRKKAGEYDPTAPLAELVEDDAEGQGRDQDDSIVEDVPSVKEIADLNGSVDATAHQGELGDDDDEGGMDVELASSQEEDDSDENDAGFSGFSSGGDKEEEEEELDDDHDDAATAAAQHQRELEAEASGLPLPLSSSSSKKRKPKKPLSAEQRAAEEQRERQVMMLSRRKAKLYGRMQHGNKLREAEREKLEGRKRALASAAGGGSSSKNKSGGAQRGGGQKRQRLT